ncbi:RNA polymerase sigma factor [Flexithrix dorotheae]|uniref:RNA polymerase sigma factor n=1 Tax=Flexithrix dorotheae TaxID=70993 RepID=UPI00037AB26C|nr:RNA polymerase sigma factor [Flexithrix dorotheae]
MKMISDEALMMKVRSGDTGKLSLLFERYNIPIYNFFLKFIGDREISQDLTQNVFFRILKYNHSFKEGASFKTWIYQIARNVRIDHYKKYKIYNSSLNTDNINEINFSENHDPIEKSEEILLIQKALSKMPEDKKEIIVLSQFQELRYKEIAEILNITENTARVKVHRAIKELSVLYKMLV